MFESRFWRFSRFPSITTVDPASVSRITTKNDNVMNYAVRIAKSERERALLRFLIAAATCTDSVEELSAALTAANRIGYAVHNEIARSGVKQYGIEKGDSAVIVAARQNRLIALQWLLQQGCSATRSRPPSALHYAATLGNAAMVKLLLEANASVDWLDNNQCDSVDLAIQGGHVDCVLLLEEALAACKPSSLSVATKTAVAVVPQTSSSHASFDAVLSVKEVTGQYAKWGGWAAAVSSCDDLEQLRQEQKDVDALLRKLDMLMESKTNFASTLISCSFTAEERNRLGSRLLDGLWFALTLQLPNADPLAVRSSSAQVDSSSVDQLLVSDSRLFMRLIRARVEFPEAIEFLLERGVDCTQSDNHALRVAARGGHALICDVLFRFGAAILPNDRHPVLFAACRKGSLATAEVLLRHGADIHAIDYHRSTAVVAVIEGGDYPELLAWLLDHGAPVDGFITIDQATALSASINFDRLGSFYLLLDRLRAWDQEILAVDGIAQGGQTTDFNVPKTSRLSSFLAERNQFQDPLLHIAVQSSRLDYVSGLLSLGIPLNVQNDIGCTALYCAFHRNDVEKAMLLINHGADVNLAAYNLHTPLHLAARYDNLSLVQLLVDHDAQLEAADRDGYTALWLAAAQQSVNAFMFLVERGAKFEPGPGTGLEYSVLLPAAEAGSVLLVRALLDRGALVDVRSPQRSSALHFAASESHVDVCKLLLERGADPNARNDDGDTPLHRAAKKARLHNGDAIEQDPVMALLLRYGADRTVLDNLGRTAADCVPSRAPG